MYYHKFPCPRLLPSGCSKLCGECAQSPQGPFVGEQSGFARPLSWRHCQSSVSPRGGNKHLAWRQELKPAQPSSSQGDPRPALRPVLSGLWHFTRNGKNLIYLATVTFFSFSAVPSLYFLEVIKGST